LLPGGRYYSETVWKDFPPGERYLYSNIGTSLLALMVEEISDIDFRDYCRQYIFDPLGMDNTTFYLGELDYDHIATPYYEPGSPMYFFSERHYPAGFANTNQVDFAKFAMSCLRKGSYEGGRLLKPSTFYKMIELKNRRSGTANLWDHYLGGSLGHIGGGTGWSTSFEMNLNSGMAFFIFANDTENSIFYPGGRINELVKYRYSSFVK
jgi:CubicO group peptidase (beta-lactamase class C family)